MTSRDEERGGERFYLSRTARCSEGEAGIAFYELDQSLARYKHTPSYHPMGMLVRILVVLNLYLSGIFLAPDPIIQRSKIKPTYPERVWNMLYNDYKINETQEV